MKYFNKLGALTFLIFSCKNYNQIIETYLDLTPPSLTRIEVAGEDSITIYSNENIVFIDNSFISREEMNINSVSYKEKSITLTFNTNLTPGKQYRSEFRVEDKNGNSLSFIANFYGYNPKIANVIINEFITKGSKTNPNKIELYVKQGGDMAGITIYNGTKNSYDSMFIFPTLIVKTGEYIVIRTLSDNYPTPFIEVDDLSVNHDKKFIDNVRDIRIDDFKLSSTNGVISIYSDPYGNIIDVIIYSKNHNDESKKNRNFGLSKTLKRVDDISRNKNWVGEFDVLFPDDVIYIGNSTSTRSLNRNNFMDRDNNSDWITVASREATFGFLNSKNEY